MLGFFDHEPIGSQIKTITDPFNHVVVARLFPFPFGGEGQGEGMRPATARTLRGAAIQIAPADSALQPMASQKARL